MTTVHAKVLILGAGSGGISVASRLSKQLPKGSVFVVDPSETHYYQPLWTLVGGGVVDKKKTARPQSQVIPKGVTWIKNSVSSVSADKKSVALLNGENISFDYLVVATGLRLAWDRISGIEGQLGKNGICTIYDYNQVDTAAQMIDTFQGGTAIFIMPPVPIKCAGAPQKIMYLADEVFRRHRIRHKTKILFATAGKLMFGVPTFSQALDKVVERKEIQPLFLHRLTGIQADKRTAIFEVTDAQGQKSSKEIVYNLIHVVPPMAPHEFISKSTLAFADGDQKGWLAVDKSTLQHKTFPFVFGIGDVTGVPNSKTGAAIRKQTPVVVKNVLSTMKGQAPMAQYDGYSSCPLVTGFGKVMLAEFGYDGKLMPTFPLNPTKERRSMWYLKKHLLPRLYWDGMLKGRA